MKQGKPVTRKKRNQNRKNNEAEQEENSEVRRRKSMENKLSVVSIIVKNEESAVKINDLLHEYRQYVVGRMGIPYRDRGVSIISVVLDAPGSVVSALSGKLGMLEGVSAKTLTAKL